MMVQAPHYTLTYVCEMKLAEDKRKLKKKIVIFNENKFQLN